MRHDHETGFSLDIPDAWETAVDPTPEIALIALAPPDATGFRRNIAVTTGPLKPAWHDMKRWQQTAVDGLFALLDQPQIIDAAVHDAGFRHLISYVGDRRALTLEQWAERWETPDGIRGLTVSATTPTLSYAAHADETQAIAMSWHPRDQEQR